MPFVRVKGTAGRHAADPYLQVSAVMLCRPAPDDLSVKVA